MNTNYEPQYLHHAAGWGWTLDEVEEVLTDPADRRAAVGR
jgi:hypothetical protein